MALMELLVNQLVNQQLVVNRWHYVSQGTPAAVTLSFALLSASGFLEAPGIPRRFPTGTFAAQMQGLMTGSSQFISAYARDLYSNTDFYEAPYPSGVVGAAGGDTSATFVALGFRTNRVRTDVRRGMKRIAGIPETTFGDLGIVSAGALAGIDALAVNMSAVLSYDDEGNTITFSPAVLGLVEYTTPKGKKAYKRYPTAALQLEHTATGVLWSPYTEARSQVSRQRGRGA